ncbi:MAG TPA: hypothetical protein VFV34_15050 [Blastocatellia bacterium]|nr:hypothetical protein [Blastocatellia bacterium]
MLKTVLVIAQLLSGVFAILPQSTPVTPKAGSPERKAIADALRVPVEKELGRKVVFKIDQLKVLDGWAFLLGQPQQPDGKRMDYRGTPYQEAKKAGAFDDGICALLNKKGDAWRVVVYVIGATDVPYVEWDKEYKAPPEIFKQALGN